VIFVTVGSLYGFDRLIQAADAAAPRFPEHEFFAQIGDGAYLPANMSHARLLDRGAFKATIANTQLIIAHAGMGSVITAMESAIPIILAPRSYELGEHNTDHQAATARWLQDRPGISVCFDTAQLGNAIAAALANRLGAAQMPRTAPPAFLDRIRDYIRSA
jgi:UDP-N-acetylglucosamine transferase subunit ALG13